MTAPILVLDTIGPWCAAALQLGDAVYEDSREIGRGHAEALAPMGYAPSETMDAPASVSLSRP